MYAEWRISEVMTGVHSQLELALQVVGAQAVSYVADRIRANKSVVTSNLVNSITWSTKRASGNVTNSTGTNLTPPREELSVKIGTNVVYAAMLEFGGVITPVNAKALAVPIHNDAKKAVIARGQSIRTAFNDLIMIKREGKPPLLIRKRGDQVWDIMYVLLKKVTIPAKPYLRPAMIENENNLKDILHFAMGGAT